MAGLISKIAARLHQWMRTERAQAAALSLIATYAFFYEYLPPLKRVQLYSDIAGYHYPLQQYAFSALKEGRFPQWDSSIYCGISFIGNVQAALLYPPTWLMYAASWTQPKLPFKFLEGFMFAHVWAAFLLGYCWLRGRTDRLPAALGAGVFAYGGYMIAQFWHVGVVSCMTWMPLGLWGVDEAAERKDWRPLWKVAVASALAFLAGYPASWLVYCVMVVTYALGGRARWRTAVGVSIALGASVLLFMVQLLPALEARGLMKLEPKYGVGAYGWSVLLSYFLPNWFDFNRVHATDFDSGCLYMYVGLAGIFAIGWAAWRHRLRPYLQALLGLAVAVLLANPPLRLLHTVERVPFLDYTLQPQNFYAGVAAMAALIAATSLHDFFASGYTGRLPQWVAPTAVAGLTAWSLRQLWIWRHGGVFPTSARALAGTAVAAGLFSLGLWACRAATGRRRLVLASVLLAAAGADYKVYGTSRQFNAVDGDYDAAQPAYGIAGIDETAYRALSANRDSRVAIDQDSGPVPTDFRMYGLATPEGFDPFLPSQYKRTIERWTPFRTNRLFSTDIENEEMLQALGVRYVMARQGISHEARLAASLRYRLVGRADIWCRVYEYLHARPPYHWEDDRAGTVVRTAWTPERREFRVHSERGGRFVLIDQFFPGWKATVDGGHVPVERWGGAFQSIQVPAGDRQIRFQFNSPGLAGGALVSLLAATALVTAILKFPRTQTERRALAAEEGVRSSRQQYPRP
jgi:hypothetical protein